MEEYKWFCCPQCGKKLFKKTQKSVVYKIKIWCKICKEEKEINIKEPKSL